MPKRLGTLFAAAVVLAGGIFFLISGPAKAAVETDYLVTGPGAGGGPHVKLWTAGGTLVKDWMAYSPSFTGGVDVAMGDLDGDLIDEVITAAGPGGGPHVKVFDLDGNDLHLDFFAYGADFHGGVNVGIADIDNDGDDEIITGAGPGGGPHVTAWDLNDAGDAMVRVASFMAGPTTNHAGVDVTGVWTNPDDDNLAQYIATSDGPNGPGFVRIFNADGVQQQSFKPYGTFTGGARISSADLNGDSQDEIITGAGAGGGPHVKAFNTDLAGQVVPGMSFFAYGADFHGGVDVGSFYESSDVNELSVVTGAGPGGGPHVRTFDPPNHASGPASFFAYPGFTGGVHVDGGLKVVGDTSTATG
ncbi:MAG: hypothetical protein QOE35_3741 [Actinomycetota bacterium]|jgi:hypothetical protein